MSVAKAVRRIILTNLNVIRAINEETGTDQILASKIAGLASTSTSAVGTAFSASSVSSAIGHQAVFSAAYSTSVRADGDYDYIVRCRVGTLEVGHTVTKLPGSLTVKPDMDNATVEITIIPITAG